MSGGSAPDRAYQMTWTTLGGDFLQRFVRKPDWPIAEWAPGGFGMNAHLYESAVTYARHGLPIFPCAFIFTNGDGLQGCSCRRADQCDKPGKHPLEKGGFHTATTDLAIIERWWLPVGRPRCFNIGLATGAASGLVVVDVDPRHSGDETLAQLEAEHGPIPPTWRFLTGGGGEHILFQHPGGHVKSSANALGPGIDVRADGGYIIAPPSTHISGRRYEISVDHHPEDVALASLPDWLLRKLGAGRGAPHVRRPSVGGSTDWQAFASTRISEGERNVAITRLAGLLFSRLNRTPHLAAELVLAWNATHCSPPLDEEEVWRTIESIAQREAQKLRGANYGQ